MGNLGDSYLLKVKRRFKKLNEENKLLTTKQAAEYLNLSEKTLAAHRCKGTGPAFIKRGRVFYLESDLNAWLEQAKYITTAQARLRRSAE